MFSPLLQDSLIWLTPLIILAASLLTGLWLRAFLLPRLMRWAATTPWEVDDVLFGAVRNLVVLWCLMAGVYMAMKFSHAPEDLVNIVGPVLKALWLFSAAWVAAGAVAQLILHYASKWRLPLPTTSLTQQLARVAVLALGVLVILDSLGVKIGSVLAALGIGSLAVALGLQDTLSNLFAGVYISLSKNVQVGDYVKLESGQEGYVTDIGLRVMKIRMLPDNVVIVPNAKFSQSVITNYHLPDLELTVTVEVGVDYASDLGLVERVTAEVGREVMTTVPGGVAGFEPFVRYHTFADSSINFTVILRAREFVDQYLIKHEFIKRLYGRYQREGINIPFPIRTVHLRQLAAGPPTAAADMRRDHPDGGSKS